MPSLYYARHPRRLDMTDGYVTKHTDWLTPERPLIMVLSTADTGICQAADLQASKRVQSARERRRRQSPSHKDRITDLVIFQPRSKLRIALTCVSNPASLKLLCVQQQHPAHSTRSTGLSKQKRRFQVEALRLFQGYFTRIVPMDRAK